MKRIFLICWLSMVAIFTLDLITTVIGLEMFTGFYEVNAFGNLLYSFGLFGYLIDLLFMSGFFYVLLIFIAGAVKVLYNSTNKLKPEFENFIYCFIAGTYVCIDSIAIISNIGNILLAI